MATSSAARAGAPLAAFVLHSYDWSESSLIVELFTRSQGRIVVVAKGAKRPTSNFRPVLLPFHPLVVFLSKPPADGNAEVRSLRAVEWQGGAPLAGPALMSGFYLNELVLKGLARQDPHPALYDAYADSIAALAVPGADEAPALRAFELKLLREMGLLPELDTVTLGSEPVQAAARYSLRPEAGVVVVAADGGHGVPGSALVAMQAALAHGSMAALRQACAGAAAALRGPLRNLVHYHLGITHLRTRQVRLGLQRLAEPASR
jgi:DNA repair protein RecO (recombination protein O)